MKRVLFFFTLPLWLIAFFGWAIYVVAGLMLLSVRAIK